MKNTTPYFKAAALAIPLTLATLPSANANPSFEVDENGIATCNGNPRAARGELATEFGNQFWSHLACAKWDRAFEILDAAPKMDMETYPSTHIPRELRTPFEACYFNSFAYDGNPFYHQRTTDLRGETAVKHGFYRLDADKFDDIEAAITYACSAGF